MGCNTSSTNPISKALKPQLVNETNTTVIDCSENKETTSATTITISSVHLSASKGDLLALRNCLSHNPTLLNDQDVNGDTPLHCALEANHIDCVLELKRSGALETVHNNKGKLAKNGSSGERTYGLAGLYCAQSIQEVEIFLNLCALEAMTEDINLVGFFELVVSLRKRDLFAETWEKYKLEQKVDIVLRNLEARRMSKAVTTISDQQQGLDLNESSLIISPLSLAEQLALTTYRETFQILEKSSYRIFCG